MAGYNALFIPGPTNIPDQIRNAMSIRLEDNRAPDFPNFSLPLFADLKKIFKTKDSQVFLFPGSGTGGWEAALTNTLSPGDKVLTSVFGQFSVLWADMCTRLGFDVDAVDVAWGEGVPIEQYAKKLEADKNKEIKAVLATHNETTTGVTSDVAAVRRILDDLDHPALLFVDGVSSIGCIDFNMDEWKVDLAVTGAQKGLMLPTGLSIVCASLRAIEACKTAQCKRCYFDFGDMMRLNKDGLFPYTPATTLLRGLRVSIDLLLEEGLDHVFMRHHRLSEGVRCAVEAWGLKLCAKEPKWHSDTVSAVMVPENIDSNDVVKLAYENYNLSIGIGLNKMAGRLFRIGHIGWLNELMILQALAGVELAMADAGVKIELGAGVGAAQKHFRTRPGTHS